jgi:uncharacterized membrane protein
MKIIYTFLASLILLASLDFIFLGLIARDFYSRLMSPVVTVEFNLIFAFLFYFFYTIGLFTFVVYPNVIVNPSLQNTIIFGAFFGFVCYMTYDFVNLATIKSWPVQLAFVDILWGTFITATISALAFKIYNLF